MYLMASVQGLGNYKCNTRRGVSYDSYSLLGQLPKVFEVAENEA